jgi:drug/metabolite transporter (DMT)-like permease
MNHTFIIAIIKSALGGFLPHVKKNILHQFSIYEFTLFINLFILCVSIPLYFKYHNLNETLIKIKKYENNWILYLYALFITIGIYMSNYITLKEQVVIYKPLLSGLNILFIYLYGYLFFDKDNNINIYKIIGTIFIFLGIFFIYE